MFSGIFHLIFMLVRTAKSALHKHEYPVVLEPKLSQLEYFLQYFFVMLFDTNRIGL